MALYQIILAYDGTGFSGFQRQGNTRTVQSVLESALKSIGWREDSILFAGRTDAGVHAAGQVVSFSLDWHHSSVQLRNAMNAKLPDDVAVIEVSRKEVEFHPRYDASSRVYRYSIYQSPTRHPLLDRFAWRIWPALDGRYLNQAAQLFLGRHDFISFGRPMKKDASTVREVTSSFWRENPGVGWVYEIRANAFLYHMVRRLVYLQVKFSRQEIELEEIEKGLNHRDMKRSGLAPARGLVLYKVNYEPQPQG